MGARRLWASTFGVVLVSAGRAGDLMGRGGIFILGVAMLFTLACVAAGLAPDAHWLNGARFVQGVGSGFMNPQALGMIQQYFKGSERGARLWFFWFHGWGFCGYWPSDWWAIHSAGRLGNWLASDIFDQCASWATGYSLSVTLLVSTPVNP